MNPLKQGLKRYYYDTYQELDRAFIHESIKTRVETLDGSGNVLCFSGIYP